MQPPNTLSCSPYAYNLDKTFRLTLTCTAVKNGNDEIDSFDLFWYRNRSCDGTVENLGSGRRQESGDQERIETAGNCTSE